MVDIVIVRRICSVCATTTEDSSDGSFEIIAAAEINIEGFESLRLHICVACQAERLSDLYQYAEVTTPEPKKASKQNQSGRFPCPNCDRTFAKAQGLGRHRAAIHKEVHLKVTPETRQKEASA